MPKDNVERALKNSDKNTADYKEVLFEGYAPMGAILVKLPRITTTERLPMFEQVLINAMVLLVLLDL